MPSFFSYNIIGASATARAHLQRLEPTTLFVMNDWGAAAWAAATLPNCRVIHRQFRSDEAVMHRTPGLTLSYLQARATERLNGSVYINIATEPDLGGTEQEKVTNLTLLTQEQLKAMQWGVANGVRVAGPHFAHYGLEERHWQYVEPLTTYIAQNADKLLFTVDEYFAGHAFSGVLDPLLPNGNERGHIQPETWKASPTPYYYHKGRVTNLFRWLVASGKPLPPTVITEDGADRLSDVEPWLNTLQIAPGYPNIRGWKTLVNQWQAWYGNRGWSPERAYFEMLYAAWREIYRPWSNVVGSTIYCWGNNGDSQWLQFDLSGASEFQSRLESADFSSAGESPVSTIPAVPKPATAGTGIRARLRTTSFINIRNAPDVRAQALSPAPGDKTLLAYYPATRRQGGSYSWYWIEVEGGVSGWQALVYENVYEQWVTPEPVAKTFRNPADYPHVILDGGKFNAPRDYSHNPTKLQKHEGLDLSSLHSVPQPRRVVAPTPGVVEKVVTNDPYYGIYVRVYHGDGYRAYYAHLSEARVTVGQQLAAGDLIGHEGATGNVSGPHLHWTVQHFGYGQANYVVEEVVDPQPLLSATPVPSDELEALRERVAELEEQVETQKAIMRRQAERLRNEVQLTLAEIIESLSSGAGDS